MEYCIAAMVLAILILAGLVYSLSRDMARVFRCLDAEADQRCTSVRAINDALFDHDARLRAQFDTASKRYGEALERETAGHHREVNIWKHLTANEVHSLKNEEQISELSRDFEAAMKVLKMHKSTPSTGPHWYKEP